MRGTWGPPGAERAHVLPALRLGIEVTSGAHRPRRRARLRFPLPFLLALVLLSLAPRAEAFTLRLLDTSAQGSPFALLEKELAPAAPDWMMLDEGGGDGSITPTRVILGMACAMGGSIATLLGGFLTYVGIYAYRSGGNDWATGIASMGLWFGAPILGLGITGLVAAYFILSGPSGSGGDLPMAVLPSTRAETDPVARSTPIATPVAFGFAF